MSHLNPDEKRSKAPERKVTAGALAGALVTLGVAVAGAFDLHVEPEVAVAAGTVLTFAVSYLVPNG